MASRRKRTTSPGFSQATDSGKRMILREIQLPSSSENSEICNYWPANPAFDPKRFLLRRIFFIKEDKTKYVSVGFYSARDYQPLVEFGATLRGGSKSLILTDEKVAALADCLPAIRDSILSVGTGSSLSARVATFGYTLRKGTARPDCLSARST